MLADGREVAVKRLFFNNRHRAADFYNEVNIISSVEHKNLVRLLGCSCSGPESLLVYEFLPNQSLDRFIFGIHSCHLCCYYFSTATAAASATDFTLVLFVCRVLKS